MLWPLFTASPPKTITLDDVMSSARDLSNLTLAHEIIVNRDFHVEQPHLPQNRYLPAQNGRPVNMAITWATQMPIDN